MEKVCQMIDEKNKSKPVRMCCVCRQHKEKDMLVRFVVEDEKIIVDSGYKRPGRGAYICKDVRCFEKSRKSKPLNRVFKVSLSEKDYDDFTNYIFRENNKL